MRAGELWAGTPAGRARKLSDEQFAEFAEIAPRYVALARSYREET